MVFRRFFIAISLKNLQNFSRMDETIQRIIEDLRQSIPENENSKVRYPGESVLSIRNENLKMGSLLTGNSGVR